MYPLIFGLLSGPPILVSWLGKILNWVPSDLQEYRLRWVVVTKETLCPGDRVTKDQAELQLQYLVSGEPNNGKPPMDTACLLYTSDAADERSSVDLGGPRIIKKKKSGDMT